MLPVGGRPPLAGWVPVPASRVQLRARAGPKPAAASRRGGEERARGSACTTGPRATPCATPWSTPTRGARAGAPRSG